jgi:hypothetical protein
MGRHLASTQARNHPISPTAAAIRNVLSVDSELSVGDDDASLNNLAESTNHYLRAEQPIPDTVSGCALAVLI